MMMMILVPQSKLLHKAGAILLLSVMMNEFLIQCLIFFSFKINSSVQEKGLVCFWNTNEPSEPQR